MTRANAARRILFAAFALAIAAGTVNAARLDSSGAPPGRGERSDIVPFHESASAPRITSPARSARTLFLGTAIFVSPLVALFALCRRATRRDRTVPRPVDYSVRRRGPPALPVLI